MNIYVPALSNAENALVKRLVERIHDKGRRNRLRTAYYDGRKAARMVGDVIPPQYGNLALCLGWAGKAVDGLARRTNIDEIIATDGTDLNALGLRELADQNFLLSEYAQARTDSLLHGVSFLVTTPGLEGEPKALVHAKSALDGTGDWNYRARRLDNFLSITARDKGKITGFVLYLPGETVTADKTDQGWNVDRTRHPFGVPVDPLVYKPRTSRRQGKSRITRPVMGIQDAAMRALLRLEGHMDIYAIPQMWLLGADESIFKNADGSFKSAWQIVMGRVFGVPDDDDPGNPNPRADVKQFDAQSPEPHLAQLNAMAKLMARETSLPDSDFALADFANPTSEGSYVQGREDLIAEAEGAADDWGPALRSTTRRALAMWNGLSEVPESWAVIDVKWRDPRYLSRAAVADAGVKVVQAMQNGPLSPVELELLGLTEDQRDRYLAHQRQQTGRNVVEAVLNANRAADTARGIARS